nr:FdtA/QdtA family cupin domain-containing protein [Vibrio lentus]
MCKNNDDYKVVELEAMGDERGQLVAIESSNQIPFDMRRVFYVYGTSGDKARGCHANKKTKFVIISVAGSCVVSVNNGRKKEDIILDVPTKGLYLNNMVWKEMHSFPKILCCLSYVVSFMIPVNTSTV